MFSLLQKHVSYSTTLEELKHSEVEIVTFKELRIYLELERERQRFSIGLSIPPMAASGADALAQQVNPPLCCTNILKGCLFQSQLIHF